MSGPLTRLLEALGDKSKLPEIPEVKPIAARVFPMIQAVHSDDGAWLMRYELDFDGVYPVEFLRFGFHMEPPRHIRNELEMKAYEHFHEKRAGGETDDE